MRQSGVDGPSRRVGEETATVPRQETAEAAVAALPTGSPWPARFAAAMLAAAVAALVVAVWWRRR